jgi:hypothetical protein
LIGSSAVLGTLPRGAVVMLTADAALLAGLTAWEFGLVQQAMANHPAVPVAKTIEMLQAFGM